MVIPKGFTIWHGGDCPVGPWDWVKVLYRDSSSDLVCASQLDWQHRASMPSLDIVAYTVRFSMTQKRQLTGRQ